MEVYKIYCEKCGPDCNCGGDCECKDCDCKKKEEVVVEFDSDFAITVH